MDTGAKERRAGEMPNDPRRDAPELLYSVLYVDVTRSLTVAMMV